MRAGRNRQEVGGIAALARGFGKLQSLEEVMLIQNGITWKGVQALADAFKKCPISTINLNDNILTEKGTKISTSVGSTQLGQYEDSYMEFFQCKFGSKLLVDF